MSRGMDGFSGQDFSLAIGHVTGVRWWKLTAPDLRCSPHDAETTWPRGLLVGANGFTWQPGVNEAVCSSNPEHKPPVEKTGNGPFDECGCVDPQTRVLTADLRWVPAGDLVVGEHLLAFEEYPGEPVTSSGRKYRDAVVTGANRAILPCYDLKFEDGTNVRCSSDHLWLCYSGNKAAHWVRTDELRTGDIRISHVVKPFDVWETDSSREAGYLAGAFDGEGSFCQREAGYTNSLSFAQAENQMLEETERCLKSLGFDYQHSVNPHGHGPPRADGSPRQDMHRLQIGRRPELVRFLGIVRPARLLPKLRPDSLGRLNMQRRMRVVEKKFSGEQEVVVLKTSTLTYIAEGFASHNCGFWAYWDLREHQIAGGGTLPVVGTVEGTGRTLIGPLGYRSQQARITALHLPFRIVRTEPVSRHRPSSDRMSSWRDAFSRPGVHHPLHGRPSREDLSGGASGYGIIEPQEADDHAMAWMAVIEDRLAGMYDAEVYATRKAMLAAHPPDTQYLPPPQPECSCDLGVLPGVTSRARGTRPERLACLRHGPGRLP